MILLVVSSEERFVFYTTRIDDRISLLRSLETTIYWDVPSHTPGKFQSHVTQQAIFEPWPFTRARFAYGSRAVIFGVHHPPSICVAGLIPKVPIYADIYAVSSDTQQSDMVYPSPHTEIHSYLYWGDPTFTFPGALGWNGFRRAVRIVRGAAVVLAEA
jgi:hypothetical protein